MMDWRPGGRGFNPRQGRQHYFVEIDHEIFSTVILSLPLIQEGQLSILFATQPTVLDALTGSENMKNWLVIILGQVV